ncbi:hypothetical protein PanWU01x14_323660 [Parasponia andersonii]|uniref:Uncharacterized protein n=1 Tax=Parasponia andersonii TaxID=3476 RepID=A0A2P5AKF3_PARAD|nr:hypothetical protein PanWU01x14_323660 [Parasponia andersonii]
MAFDEEKGKRGALDPVELKMARIQEFWTSAVQVSNLNWVEGKEWLRDTALFVKEIGALEETNAQSTESTEAECGRYTSLCSGKISNLIGGQDRQLLHVFLLVRMFVNKS